MLFRQDDGDDSAVVAIPQPSHSWLSGQLVRAWGNGRFDRPAPHEEVCLAAEQHDIGWLPWEAAPTLNPETGRPHQFMELGAAVHTRLWTGGVRMALAFGRYPALLVSLHANTIYGRFFDFAKASPEDAAIVRDFLDGQHAFQHASVEALAADPRYAAAGAARLETIEHNRLLVGAADWMSLAICWGVAGETRIPDVPTTGGTGRTELRLASPHGSTASLTVDPWPFAEDRVEVVCEGRRLRGRFADEAAMRDALEAAEPVTIRTVLHPTA
ncbi:MAG TPA: DUF3891 family protein [Stellaceae bacterium]|jgi:hypothetical protein